MQDDADPVAVGGKTQGIAARPHGDSLSGQSFRAAGPGSGIRHAAVGFHRAIRRLFGPHPDRQRPQTVPETGEPVRAGNEQRQRRGGPGKDTESEKIASGFHS